jgi:hypothetical protein
MIQVKRYKSDKAYRRDASRMATGGWRVVNATSEQPRSGCMRIILTGGIGALIWKPKPQTIVTYER